ncbi:flavin monoamine oxidase family protein [Tunicatimonas pelagia]|uniref:flavin monoamine oxidase family protein n=1 Tax=Tunicatimonas pelagia TaxID=931531 RepID=UPI0026667DD2|nr:FAD-dependent oxidoreductase [Tunicatimonas pelagia]WKN42071.1 FAD-dependent oxidoreductase [Tunicatimonas pelagia]
MTRKEFVKVLGLLGIYSPLNHVFGKGNRPEPSRFSGNVLIIGAGAAGLTSGFLLKQRGIEFRILEATSQYGGRMSVNRSFADFPIALGAEWLSSNTIRFEPLADSKKVLSEIQTVGYLPDEEYEIWDRGKLIRGSFQSFNDRKFVNSSWLEVFERYVLSSIKESIVYETPIHSIDFSGDKIVVKSPAGEYTADRVIVTAPLSLLQNGSIRFTPSLPEKKTEVMNETLVWDGFKAFFEFEKKFYPSFVDYLIQPETDGQVSLYDAAWGQKSTKNVLGLFSVGRPATRYGDLADEVFKEEILKEFDDIFAGQASRYYLKHMTQHWSKEPFAQGAYVSDYTERGVFKYLRAPVEDKLFFAGDAYTDGYDWGNVHNAIQSAAHSVNQILLNN